MTRALRRDHRDVDVGRRLDVAEADVEAVPEEDRVAVLEVRLDRLGVELALRRVGRQHHDQVGLGRGLGRREHPQALVLGLGPALGALGQADPDVDAGVAQRQRVRVALAAVAEHGDLAALDDRQVGVVVVEDLHGHAGGSRFLARCWLVGTRVVVSRIVQAALRSTARSAAWVIDRGPRPSATMPDCTISRMPYGSSIFSIASSLSGRPVSSTVTASGPTSTTLALNSSTICEHVAARGLVGAHLDQQQLALHGLLLLQLDDLEDVDQLVELLGDLLERGALDAHQDRDARDLLVLGRADRERLDVEAAPAEQARDPGEHAGLVLDQHRQACACRRSTADTFQDERRSAARAVQRRWCRAAARARRRRASSSPCSVQARTTAWAPSATSLLDRRSR